ncbi:alpha/beta hydrolase [Denitratisoma sp. agr-D3]
MTLRPSCRRPLLLASAALLTGLALPPADAGPLLDRLKERRAERAATADNSAVGQRVDSAAAEGSPLRNLAYGPAPEQKLDVYLPAKGTAGAPVVFMVHGGAWKIGDKDHSKVVEHKTERWLPKGIVLVSVNYPMLPQADPLQQAQSVAKALAYAQANAARWGGDPDKFVLMGHSAGAHLIALLNADPGLARGLGAHPWLGAVALDSAAMDVPAIMAAKHYGFYDEAFGKDPAYWRKASPRHVLTAAAPPLLMVCSTRRSDSCAQADAMASQAQGLGLRTEVLRQPLSHGDINGELGKPGAYTERVEAFMATLDGTLASRLRP